MNINTFAKEIPKTVVVGHLPYSVSYADGWITLEDSKKWGTCNHEKAEIMISGPECMPSKEMLVSVFMHEVLHALWCQANLPDKAKEEQAVSGLEFALTGFMKNNPKAIAWVMKGLK